MKATRKLDVVVDGVRYRSTRLLDNCGVLRTGVVVYGAYSEPESHGVKVVRVWLCRAMVLVETYSIWDDGTGACVGTRYHVADQHELETLLRKSQDPDLEPYVRRNAVPEAA
jgi:hypothetical protein